MASGKYVYFLDSDDTVEPNLLETVVPYMEQGADLVAFTFRELYDNGDRELPWKHETGEYYTDSPKKKLDFIQRVILQSKIGWDAWSRIFVREKIEQYGLRFADNRKIFAEDLYFSLCYCAHVEHIISLDECLYNCRLRTDSIMGVQNTRNNLPRIMLLADSVLEYYNQFEDCALLRENFGRIWFQIFMNQFMFQILNVEDQQSFRETIIRDLSDWDALSDILKQQMKDTLFWKKQYSFVRFFELHANVEFLLHGNLRKFKLSCWLVRRIKNQYERFGQLVP